MPPFVFLRAAATPAEPRALVPVGQLTATPLPIFDFHDALALERYSVRLYVVPELSLRWIGVMSRFGRLTPGFSFAIAGSFHFWIVFWKIPASTEPLKRRRLLRPGTLYGIDVPPSAHGICTQPLQAANWSGVSGASLAPKSTVRFVTAEMPPPDPIGPYVILIP